MVISFIRDESLPMHVNHVQFFDFARENPGYQNILIFGHVVICCIENNIGKKSNIETDMVRAKYQERGQTIGSLQADTLQKGVCDILYEYNFIIDKRTLILNLIHSNSKQNFKSQ